MGNSCLITTEKKEMCIYLHWNGGLDSVIPFIEYCKLQGFRDLDSDSYGWARLAQVIGNFFGGSLSIGISSFKEMNYRTDNGHHIIKNWSVVGYPAELFDQRELVGSLLIIDERQPKHMQISEYIKGKEIATTEIKLGDQAFMQKLDGTYEKYEVIGFGDDCFVNGSNVNGVPFVKYFGVDSDMESYKKNVNNYLRSEKVRISVS